MSPSFLLLILAFVGCSFCAELSDCYTTVFFWYAYRLERSLNRDDNKLAAGCRGSAAGGHCNFDEFIKHVEMVPDFSPSFRPFRGSTGINIDNPDTHFAADKLQKSGYNCGVNYQKLFSKQSAEWGVTDRIREFFTSTDEVVGDIRREAVARDPNSQKVKDLESSGFKAFNARQAAYSGGIVDNLKLIVESASSSSPDTPRFFYKTKTFEAWGGDVRYEEFDADRTFRENPGKEADVRVFLDRFYRSLENGDLGDDSQRNSHMLRQWGAMLGRIGSSNPVCAPR